MSSLRAPALRAAVAIGLAAVLLALALSAQGPRSALARFALGVFLATHGMHLTGGELSVGRDRLISTGLEIDDDHGRVLSVTRLVIDYDWHALFGRSDRRYGIRTIDVERPALRIVMLPDGSTNLSSFAPRPAPAVGAPVPPSTQALTPYDLSLRVRDGRVDVENASAYARPGRAFAVTGIDADAALRRGIGLAGLRAVYDAAGSASLIQGTGTENDAVGFAQIQLRANGVAFAPLLDAVISTPLFVVQRGVADVSLRIFDVGYAGAGPDWRVSGIAHVRDGRMHVVPLDVPVRDIQGDMTLSDGYLGFGALYGDAAGLPVEARGSILLIPSVRFAFALRTHGDLHAARRLLAFSHDQPVDGAFDARLRIDGPPSDVHVAGDVTGRGGDEHVGSAPLRSARARFYYQNGHVTLPLLEAAYDGGRVAADGDIALGTGPSEPSFQAIATATAPASGVPLVANLNRGATVQALASIDGPPSSAQIYAFGRTLGGSGARATFDLAGVSNVTLAGAARIAWPRGDATVRVAFTRMDLANRALRVSFVATHAPVRLLGASASLPGLTPVISLPDGAGTLDGVALLRGSDAPDGALQTAIDLRGRDVVVQGARVGAFAIRARGSGPRIALDTLSVDGADVTLRASGVARVDQRTLAPAAQLRGSGSVDLTPFGRAAGVPATGRMRGDFVASLSGSGWAMSARSSGGDATLSGTTLHDVALEATAARGDPLRYAVRAGMLRGTIGMVGTPADASVFANGIDLAALRPAGMPLDAGTAVVIGRFTRGGGGAAELSGSVLLANGRMGATPLTGSADLTYASRVLSGSGDLDIAGTRVYIRGTARDLAAHAPAGAALDAVASVREGDLAGVLGPYLPRALPVTGGFNADVAVRGPLAAPQVVGDITSQAATLRGVTLLGNASAFDYHSGSFTVRNGTTQLGNSKLEFGGSYAPGGAQLHASSAHVDLSDINDFFEGRDVLDGLGTASLAVSFAPGSAHARGAADLSGAYVAGLPLGNVVATLGDAGTDRLHVDVAQRSELGSSAMTGDLTFHGHDQVVPDVLHATYLVHAQASNVDLGLVARLTGLEDVGMHGLLDAGGQLRGTFSRPAVDVTFDVRDGYIRKLQLNKAHGRLTSDGTNVALRDALIDTPFGQMTAAGGFGRTGALSGSAHLAVSDLHGLAQLVMPGIDVSGAAQADLHLGGRMRHPTIGGSVTAAPGAIYGVAYDQLTAHATYSDNAVAIGDTSLRLAHGQGTLTLSGTLPIQLAPFGLGPPRRPVDLQVAAAGVDVTAFDPLVKEMGTFGGILDANASVTGTAGKPELQGSAHLRGGALTSRYETVPLTAISADLALSHDAIALSALSGRAGNGTFRGSGRAYVVPAVGLRKTPGIAYYADLTVDNAPVDVPNWVSGTWNGELGLTQSGSTPLLAGTVALRDGTIPVSAVVQLATTLGDTAGPPPTANIPGVPALLPGHTIAYGGAIYPPGVHVLTQAPLATPAPTFFDLPSLNLQVSTQARNVRVRGGPVDLTTDGALDIGGSVRDPQLTGEFTAKRGTISAAGVTFRVEHGALTFDPDQGVLPSLDASATTVISGDRITLDVYGRVDHLNTVLSSSSGATPEQILSSIATGSTVGAFAGGITQQTISTGAQRLLSAELTRSILAPFSTALAQSLNIEEVSLEFNALGQIVVEVRKYVSPMVALLYGSTISQPITQYWGASYRVRDYAALELTTTTAPSGFVTYQVGVRVTFR